MFMYTLEMNWKTQEVTRVRFAAPTKSLMGERYHEMKEIEPRRELKLT